MTARIGQNVGRGRRNFIKEWRDHRKLTLEQLAELVDSTKSGVQKIESGESGYNPDSLAAIAEALHCTPADLIQRGPGEFDANILYQQAPPEVRRIVEKILKPDGE